MAHQGDVGAPLGGQVKVMKHAFNADVFKYDLASTDAQFFFGCVVQFAR